MGKKNATREQKRAFLLELRCQWLENGKSLDKVSVKRLRHLYKVGTVPKEQLSMLLEKGAVTDQIIDEFEAMVTEYFRKGNERRNTLKENTKPTDQMDYPTAPLPPDYNKPNQTAIDFDGSDWQRAIVKIADILEERQECKSSTNVYRWLRKLLEEFGVYKRDEVLLEAREATICWYASQIAGNSPYPEFNG